MGTIKGLLENAKRAESSFNSDLKIAVEFVADDLLYLQREKQLFEGIGNDGNIIGVYRKATESITEGMMGIGYPKLAGSPMNFYASGNLFKSFAYRFQNNDTLEIFATDAKIEDLKARYPTMIGLSPENTSEFNYKYLLNPLKGAISRHFRQ